MGSPGPTGVRRLGEKKKFLLFSLLIGSVTKSSTLVLQVLQVTNVILSVPEARKPDLCFAIKVSMYPKIGSNYHVGFTRNIVIHFTNL